MFTSIKSFINSRVGRGVVKDDFINEYGFFIKVEPIHLYSVAFFLKYDPDVKLTLLDQIICIPAKIISWNNDIKNPTQKSLEILYQFKSLKLPYKVTLVIEIDSDAIIPSLTPLFEGAHYFETDICFHHHLQIDKSEREQ